MGAHDFRPAIKYLGMFESNVLWNNFTEGSKYIEISTDRKTARRTIPILSLWDRSVNWVKGNDPNENSHTVVAGPWVPCSGRATGTVKILSEGYVRIGLVTNERQLDYNSPCLQETAYRSWTYGSRPGPWAFDNMTYCENGGIFARDIM